MLFAPTRKKHRAIPSEFATRDFYVEMQPEVMTPVRLQLSLGDPTVYLLPSDMGFSSTLRQQRAISKMEPEVSDPPVEVRLFQTEREDQELSSFRALTMNQVSLNESGAPDAGVVLEAPADEESGLRVSGGIVDRLPTGTLAPPKITANEVLGPTVLRVGVAPQGGVMAVVLEKSSGMDKADEAAARFVKGIRFMPAESAAEGSMEWGIIRIIWRAERSSSKS